MNTPEYPDRDHLTQHAKLLFPDATIVVQYTDDDEVIHLFVDDVEFIFEIGSDDDEYVFANGNTLFRIPLMDS
jgi:hypothetical protein